MINFWKVIIEKEQPKISPEGSSHPFHFSVSIGIVKIKHKHILVFGYGSRFKKYFINIAKKIKK